MLSSSTSRVHILFHLKIVVLLLTSIVTQARVDLAEFFLRPPGDYDYVQWTVSAENMVRQDWKRKRKSEGIISKH